MALHAVRSPSSRQLSFPQHEHASDHKVSAALAQYKTKERLRAAARRPPCAEVAARRIQEYFWDVGDEMGHVRWIAEVARRCEMSYSTVWRIVRGARTRVGPDVVDQIARVTGCPVRVFYDAEF